MKIARPKIRKKVLVLAAVFFALSAIIGVVYATSNIQAIVETFNLTSSANGSNQNNIETFGLCVNFLNVISCSQPSSTQVTQQITCTVANSGPATTLVLSGVAGPSPTSVACDGTTYSVTANPSASLIATLPADQPTSRYRFSGNAISAVHTTCSSGTCSAWVLTVYYQLGETYIISAVGTSKGTFNSGLTFTLTGTFLGAGSSTIATIASNTGSSVAVFGWTDYSKAVTFPTNPTGAASNTAWNSTGITNFTDTVGGQTHSVTYWFMLKNTYRATPSSPATFDAILNIPVTGQQLGVGGQTGCTIVTSNGGGTVGCSGFFDYNLVVTVTAPIPDGSHAWLATSSTVFQQTTGGNTNTVTYILGKLVTLKITLATGGPVGVGAVSGCSVQPTSITFNGVSQSFGVTSACSSLTVTVPSAGTSTRYRFNTAGSPVTTWTINPVVNSTSVWYQLDETYQATPVTPSTWNAGATVAVTDTSVGVSGTVCSITVSNLGGAARCSGWSDFNRAVTVPTTIVGYSATPVGSNVFTPTTGGLTLNVNYQNVRQVCLSYTLQLGGSFNAPTFTYGSASVAVSTSNTCYTIAVGTSYSVSVLLPGASSSASERAVTANTTSGTITAAHTWVFIYYHQFYVSFKWTVGSGSPVGNPALSARANGSAFTPSLSHTVKAYWLDAGSRWTVPNPWFTNLHYFTPSQAGGLVNVGGGFTTNIVYTTGTPTCTSTDPTVLIQEPCPAGAIFFVWYEVFGPFFMPILDFMAALAVYMRTESPALGTTVYIVLSIVITAGGVVGGIPASVQNVGPLLLGAVITGSVFQLWRSGKGG